MQIIVFLVILGLVVYFVDMVPVAPVFHQIVRAFAIAVAVVAVLQWFGVNTFLPAIPFVE